MASNNHARCAEATLRPMKSCDSFCSTMDAFIKCLHDASAKQHTKRHHSLALNSIEACLCVAQPLHSDDRAAIQGADRAEASIDASGSYVICVSAGVCYWADVLYIQLQRPYQTPVPLSSSCTCTEQAPQPPSLQAFFVPYKSSFRWFTVNLLLGNS